MPEVAGLMSNTIQYTYGVIGAAESSTTSAKLFVPAGSPAQLSGGLSALPPSHVYRAGIVFARNAPLPTVITLGEEILLLNSPHPVTGSAQTAAAAAAATPRARCVNLPRPMPSTCSPPLPDLRPWRRRVRPMRAT